MGWGGSWLAVRGVPVEDALRTLQLRRTGTLVQQGDDPMLAGGLLESGWYVVFRNDRSRRVFSEFALEDLSRGGEGVHGSFEEHAMGSSAAYWRDGQRIWSVDREAGGPYAPLTVEGDPPPGFAALKERLFVRQEQEGGEEAGVDYIYDLPIELAQETTGFTHEVALDRLGFELLEDLRPLPPPPPKKPWWKLW